MSRIETDRSAVYACTILSVFPLTSRISRGGGVAELAEALKIWWGSFYVFYGNSQKLVGQAIVNLEKSGRAAALPAQ